MWFIFDLNFRAHFDRAKLRIAVLAMFAANACSPLSGQVSSAASPQPVAGSNVKAPAGSYKLSCLVLDVRGNALRTICQAINGDWRTSELRNADRCPGDISNDNGKLKCSPDGKMELPDASLDPLGFGGFEPYQRLSRPEAANWQLEHETWTFKDGAPENTYAVAQTTDGFLWLGGSGGLYRFDGKQFESFRSPFGDELLALTISSLYAPPSGGLWIGYLFGGFSFLYQGRVTNYAELATKTGAILLMVEDKDGIVWATGLSSGLWKFEHSRWEHVGMEWNVPLNRVNEVALDRDGNLWVNGEGKLLCLRKGSRTFQVVKDNLPLDAQRFDSTQRLLDREGNIWFVSGKGLDRFFYSPLLKQQLPDPFPIHALAADDDGKVLVAGFQSTLYRVDSPGLEYFPRSVRLQIWLLYRAHDGTIWLGTSGGLWHETMSHQRPVQVPREPSAQFDVRKALWQFTGRDWKFLEYPREASSNGYSAWAIADDRLGGVWVSFNRGGLFRLANGAWTPYSRRTEFPATGVICEFTDSMGRVWFGYRHNQLAVLNGDHVQVFGPDDGLRIGNIAAIQGRGPDVWIGGEFGLEQFNAGHIKNIRAVDPEWLRGITGIVETANGDVWLNGLTGIFHIRHSELARALKDPSYRVKGDHLGRRDGIPGFAMQFRMLSSAIEASNKRLWFSVTNGIASIDPANFERRAPTPPIVIQSVAADDKIYDPTLPERFPAHTTSVQIIYSAVSLSNPEAIRFRYRLQETDPDWHEADIASPVSYRNLSPGSYHFRVASTDTNGDWSDKVATVEFTILPAFYQTRWFLLLCTTVSLCLVWIAIRLRIRRLSGQIRERAEVRADERVRIARDLHDTLLQGVQGLMLHFHVAAQELPEGSKTRGSMERALATADRILVEGRNRVTRLRTDDLPHVDLRDAFEAVAADLNGGHRVQFVLNVEGPVEEVASPVAHELYYIGREAISNAFRHANASEIAVELNCGPKSVVLVVTDNGCGFDPVTQETHPRGGHWGLQGMMERAEAVGARFECRSSVGKGTEVTVTIPARRAYEKQSTVGHGRAPAL